MAWRRGWDSNPRYGYPYNGFRDRSPKGLRTQSKAGWRTFISNHAQGIAALDLFVVPTLSFRLLFGLLILRHDRREILWLGVTARLNGLRSRSRKQSAGRSHQ